VIKPGKEADNVEDAGRWWRSYYWRQARWLSRCEDSGVAVDDFARGLHLNGGSVVASWRMVRRGQ